MERFRQEARAVAALDHPHILALHDLGSENGTLFAVFELLEGQTLRQRLQVGPLPVRKALELALQMCRGLHAAHARGIVHRDLKPDNVFLTHDGHVKILDFGLAELREHEGPDGPRRGGGHRHPHERALSERHRGLHVARAAPRGEGQPVRRSLRPRGRVLRDDQRQAALRRGDPRREPGRGADPRSSRSHGRGGRAAARPRASRASLPREGPQGALPLGPRSRLRPRGRAGRNRGGRDPGPGLAQAHAACVDSGRVDARSRGPGSGPGLLRWAARRRGSRLHPAHVPTGMGELRALRPRRPHRGLHRRLGRGSAGDLRHAHRRPRLPLSRPPSRGPALDLVARRAGHPQGPPPAAGDLLARHPRHRPPGRGHAPRSAAGRERGRLGSRRACAGRAPLRGRRAADRVPPGRDGLSLRRRACACSACLPTAGASPSSRGRSHVSSSSPSSSTPIVAPSWRSTFPRTSSAWPGPRRTGRSGSRWERARPGAMWWR